MLVRVAALVLVCGAVLTGLVGLICSPTRVTASGKPPDGYGNFSMNHPDEYAWQVFIDLNRPANDGTRNVVWETWATDSDTFPTKPDPAKPPIWPGAPKRPKTLSAATQLRLAHKLRQNAQTKLEAKPPPVPTLTEEIRRNRIQFDYIIANKLWYLEGLEDALKNGRTIQAPLGAIMVKAKWKPLAESDKPRYHWNVTAQGQLHGLVALHISIKVLPHWFWTTFEQVDNPDRGKELGCKDSFGLEPPNTCDGAPSKALLQMFQDAGFGSQWQYYRLNGTQVDFTDATGRPTLLGNSEIEGPEGVMPTSSCMTCHAKAVMDASGHSLPIEKQSSPPEGDVGIPNPDWFYNSQGKRKTLQLGFTWGFLNAQSIHPPAKTP